MAQVKNWTPENVRAALDAQEVVLIDVRTPPECMMEHIDGALLMPVAFFRPEALPIQDSPRTVLQCGSGARSGKMVEIALKAGKSPFAHMEGGFAACKQAGLPYTSADMATGAPKAMDANS